MSPPDAVPRNPGEIVSFLRAALRRFDLDDLFGVAAHMRAASAEPETGGGA